MKIKLRRRPRPAGAGQAGQEEPQDQLQDELREEGQDELLDELAAPRRRPRRRLLVVLLALLVLGAGATAALASGALAFGQPPPSETTIALPVTRGTLDITVESSGSVKPSASLDLSFQSAGRLAALLVKPGDQVRQGQPLARLDQGELELALLTAEAELKTAQLELEALSSSEVEPHEREQAEAGVKSARAQLERVRTGNIKAADITGARASLRSAQARLEALRNPSPEQRSAAELSLRQAEERLANSISAGALAKENSYQALQQAANEVRNAQQELNRVYWETHAGDGGWKLGPGDPQYQSEIDRYERAVRDEQDAQSRMRQAQAAHDTAISQDRSDVAIAQSQVDDARRQLDALASPDQADIVEAEANVTQAQAQLDKLLSGGTRADIADAQAQLENAQSGLDALSAPPTRLELADAEARLAQAQVQLETARRTLQGATLLAPFSGTIASTSAITGAQLSAGASLIKLVDISSLLLTVNLGESDVARVKLGQTVQISLDALPETSLQGSVEAISPVGESQQGLVVYPAEIVFSPGAAPVKPGMSASASILVERKEGVLKVPNRALQTSGPFKTLQVLYGDAQTPVSLRVETGASDGMSTEILRCLDTGDQCLREGDQLAMALPPAGGGGQLGPGAGDVFMLPAGGAMPAGPGQMIHIGP